MYTRANKRHRRDRAPNEWRGTTENEPVLSRTSWLAKALGKTHAHIYEHTGRANIHGHVYIKTVGYMRTAHVREHTTLSFIQRTSRWHRNANTSCLAWCFLAIAVATGDAFARVFEASGV